MELFQAISGNSEPAGWGARLGNWSDSVFRAAWFLEENNISFAPKLHSSLGILRFNRLISLQHPVLMFPFHLARKLCEFVARFRNFYNLLRRTQVSMDKHGLWLMRMIITMKFVSVFQDLEIKRKKHSLVNDRSFEHLEHIKGWCWLLIYGKHKLDRFRRRTGHWEVSVWCRIQL